MTNRTRGMGPAAAAGVICALLLSGCGTTPADGNGEPATASTASRSQDIDVAVDWLQEEFTGDPEPQGPLPRVDLTDSNTLTLFRIGSARECEPEPTGVFTLTPDGELVVEVGSVYDPEYCTYDAHYWQTSLTLDDAYINEIGSVAVKNVITGSESHTAVSR